MAADARAGNTRHHQVPRVREELDAAGKTDREVGDALPHGRIAAAANVRVQPHYTQLVLLHRLLHLRNATTRIQRSVTCEVSNQRTVQQAQHAIEAGGASKPTQR